MTTTKSNEAFANLATLYMSAPNSPDTAEYRFRITQMFPRSEAEAIITRALDAAGIVGNDPAERRAYIARRSAR